MRIRMLSDVYFPRINGVSTSIQTFRRQFTALGHEVLLIAPSYGPATEPEAGIVRLQARTVPFDPEDRVMGFKAALELEPALRERRFDLIHIQTPFVAHYAGAELSRRLGLPRVETYHTFFEEYLHHYIPVIPGPWTRALARRFSCAQCNELDAVVVPSRAMLEVLREYGVNVPLEIIPTGIELERLSSGNGTAFRQRHGIPPQRPVLVHVGRVAFEKNIDFLLRMLVGVRADVPEVLLVVAGEGPSSRHLQRLARHLGLERNVLFVGYLDRRNALTRLLLRRGRLRVRVAYGDPGPRPARGDGPGSTGRVNRSHGHARHPGAVHRGLGVAGRRNGVRRPGSGAASRSDSAGAAVARGASACSGMGRAPDGGSHAGLLCPCPRRRWPGPPDACPGWENSIALTPFCDWQSRSGVDWRHGHQ